MEDCKNKNILKSDNVSPVLSKLISINLLETKSLTGGGCSIVVRLVIAF